MTVCASATCFSDITDPTDAFCASCRELISRAMGMLPLSLTSGGAQAMEADPPPTLPPRLLDATRIARDLWDFFITVMRTDGVIGKTQKSVQLMDSLDDFDMERAAAFIEAVKSQVVNEYAVAVRDLVDRVRNERAASVQAEAPVADGSVFVGGYLPSPAPRGSQVNRERLCYGCLRNQASPTDGLCRSCLGAP